ncbi:hypothetical protein ACFWZ2_13140 [Streptomyces sp. NPDC059002]|uniref:hypothetical protein n=1 Tax=Streptomyces sp. NPDC059002 TaxID=3346690 RepID=UPI00367CC1FC
MWTYSVHPLHNSLWIQLDDVTEGHMPNHCSAPHSSNRSTSVNPNFAARLPEFGAAWPDRVPVQTQAKEAHPLFAEYIDAARALVSGESPRPTRRRTSGSPVHRLPPIGQVLVP